MGIVPSHEGGAERDGLSQVTSSAQMNHGESGGQNDASGGAPSPRAGRFRYRSWQQQIVQAFLSDKAGLFGLLLLLAVTLVAVFAPWISPFSPMEVRLTERLMPPLAWAQDGRAHALGTDHLGRDVLSRIAYGARTSLVVGLVCSVCAALLGTVLGLVAGYAGGKTEDTIMRLADMQLAFPYMVLAVAFIALLGADLVILMVLLVVLNWPLFARVVRADTLAAKEKEYVTAARASGASSTRILLVHILPNVASSALVLWSFVFARLIVVESSLSFLGLGVPPPTPTLGIMLSDGRGYMDTAWWLTIGPGLVILLITLSANFVGDAMRDALDPQLRAL